MQTYAERQDSKSKHEYFNGLMFTRDEATGYYLCSKSTDPGTNTRKRMHVYVWEFFNGAVPPGYHVHHIDENKANNDISNLELLSEAEHLSIHGKEHAARNYDEMVQNLVNNAIPAATKWHGSQQGKEWHKHHYEKMKCRLHVPKEYICEVCGKHFTSTVVWSRFCSNNCKSEWRRKSGVDDVAKICAGCGKEFKTNKYAKRKFCESCRRQKSRA